MSTAFELSVQVRHETGKAHIRRMRHQGLVPGVIYGAGKETQLITLPHDAILHALFDEAFYSHILSIRLENGRTETVVLKDVQRHVYKPKILHVDFLRVNAAEKLTMHVPLHFVGEDKCAGVKEGSMVLSKLITELEIKCLPAALPEFIEVDISHVTAGHSFHISAVQLPKGVELARELNEDNDHVVANVHAAKTKGVATESEDEDKGADTASSASETAA